MSAQQPLFPPRRINMLVYLHGLTPSNIGYLTRTSCKMHCIIIYYRKHISLLKQICTSKHCHIEEWGRIIQRQLKVLVFSWLWIGFDWCINILYMHNCRFNQGHIIAGRKPSNEEKPVYEQPRQRMPIRAVKPESALEIVTRRPLTIKTYKI